MLKKICSQCFSLLGERTRAKIIQQLKQKSSNVKEIAKYFSLTQPTISHHLKSLENQRIISSKKRGREIYYFLNKKYPCKKCSLLKIPLKT